MKYRTMLVKGYMLNLQLFAEGSEELMTAGMMEKRTLTVMTTMMVVTMIRMRRNIPRRTSMML